MIVKTKDERGGGGGVFGAAGDKAERQMAHYLARAFDAAADVLVFHDLRLELKDGADAVQVDHLIVHRHGLVIIESKSVSSKVKVNAQGEWMRWWNGRWQGMASPVEQGKRQAEALRGVLVAHKEELREKKLLGMVQGGFKHCPIEVIVAISDDGMFEEGSERPREAMKAEAVVGAVRSLVERHRKGGTLLGRLTKPADAEDGAYVLTDEEIGRVCRFLVERHTARGGRGDRGEQTVEKAAAVGVVPTERRVEAAGARGGDRAGAGVVEQGKGGMECKHCGGREGVAQWGKWGYYLRCGACGKNTGLETKCAGCGREVKVRKEGPRFWRECVEGEGGCGARVVVWENVG